MKKFFVIFFLGGFYPGDAQQSPGSGTWLSFQAPVNFLKHWQWHNDAGYRTLGVSVLPLQYLYKRLGLSQRAPRQIEKERQMGHFYAARAARTELDRLHEWGMISGSLWEAMAEAQEAELQPHDQDVQAMWQKYPGMSTEFAIQVRRAMLRAERTALAEANQQEIVSEDVQHEMMELIDARMELLHLLEERGTTIPLIRDEDQES